MSSFIKNSVVKNCIAQAVISYCVFSSTWIKASESWAAKAISKDC